MKLTITVVSIKKNINKYINLTTVSLFFFNYKKKKKLKVLLGLIKILGIPNRRVLYFYDFLYNQIVIVLTF